MVVRILCRQARPLSGRLLAAGRTEDQTPLWRVLAGVPHCVQRQQCASPAVAGAASQPKSQHHASKSSAVDSLAANAGAYTGEKTAPVPTWKKSVLSWLGFAPADTGTAPAGTNGMHGAGSTAKAVVRADGKDQARSTASFGRGTGPSVTETSTQPSDSVPRAASQPTTPRNGAKLDNRHNPSPVSQADSGTTQEKPCQAPKPTGAASSGEAAVPAAESNRPLSPTQPKPRTVPRHVINLDRRLADFVCAPIPYGVADIEERLLHQWVVLRRASLFPAHPFILAYEYHCGNAALNFRGDLLLWDGVGDSVLAVELKYLGLNVAEKLKKVREQAAKAEIFLLDYLMRLQEADSASDGDERKRLAFGGSSSPWNRCMSSLAIKSLPTSRGSAVITNEIRNCPPWSTLSDKARAALQQDYDEFCTGTVVVNQLATQDKYLNKSLASITEELLPTVSEPATPSSAPEMSSLVAEDEGGDDDDKEEAGGDVSRHVAEQSNAIQVSPEAVRQVVMDVGKGNPVPIDALARTLVSHPDFGGRLPPSALRRHFKSYAGVPLKQFLAEHPGFFSLQAIGKTLMVVIQPGWQDKKVSEAI